MKKLVTACVALVVAGWSLFAAETGARLVVGGSVPLYVLPDPGYYEYSAGLTFATYDEFSSLDGWGPYGAVTLGFFLNGSDGSISVDGSDYDVALDVSAIFGLYKVLQLSKKVAIVSAGGFALKEITRTTDYMATLGFDIGLGVDIGARYMANAKSGVMAGVRASWYPAEWGIVKISGFGTDSGWTKDFNAIQMEPYVAYVFHWTKRKGEAY